MKAFESVSPENSGRLETWGVGGNKEPHPGLPHWERVNGYSKVGRPPQHSQNPFMLTPDVEESFHLTE